MFKSSFITIIGKTNVGKSTLLNTLLPHKVSITSAKPRTTQKQIIGICHDPNYQLIFIDTPGIFVHHKNKLVYNAVNSAIFEDLKDIDIILFMVDDICNKAEQVILEKITEYHKKIILVINKIDLCKNKMVIDRIIASYLTHYNFDYVVPLSAINKKNLNILKDMIVELSPGKEMHFSQDIITDISENDLIADLVREKILFYFHKEIPYVISVIIEYIQTKPEEELTEIAASIIVAKPSQRKILIGKQGSKLKKVSTEARKEIKKILKKRIYLDLWVKVKKKNSPQNIY